MIFFNVAYEKQSQNQWLWYNFKVPIHFNQEKNPANNYGQISFTFSSIWPWSLNNHLRNHQNARSSYDKNYLYCRVRVHSRVSPRGWVTPGLINWPQSSVAARDSVSLTGQSTGINMRTFLMFALGAITLICPSQAQTCKLYLLIVYMILFLTLGLFNFV